MMKEFVTSRAFSCLSPKVCYLLTVDRKEKFIIVARGLTIRELSLSPPLENGFSLQLQKPLFSHTQKRDPRF